MKYFILVILSLIVISCRDTNKHQLSKNEEIAIEKGKEAAKSVIDAAPGMEREKAILSIRAKQHEIALAGDSAAASAFASAVKECLDSADILH